MIFLGFFTRLPFKPVEEKPSLGVPEGEYPEFSLNAKTRVQVCAPTCTGEFAIRLRARAISQRTIDFLSLKSTSQAPIPMSYGVSRRLHLRSAEPFPSTCAGATPAAPFPRPGSRLPVGRSALPNARSSHTRDPGAGLCGRPRALRPFPAFPCLLFP